MSFLQPWLLLALPLAALPILIHLINQRRFQNIQWAAMMFLLAATRMSRGYSRIRQWLILAFRTLAILGLLVAIARPLASGWLGLAAGQQADTTIILLDRSPSMQERSAAAGQSKLEAGRNQLARTFETLKSKRWVLIESFSRAATEIESPDALLSLPSAGPSSSSADIPAMLETAHNYIRDNRPGRTEVWICSDLRESDWKSEDGRWNTVRDGMLAFPTSIRFHLLSYEPTSEVNYTIRVGETRMTRSADSSEVLVSFSITRTPPAESKISIPVQFEIGGARSTMNVELTGTAADIKNHAIPLESKLDRSWGRVSIPSDANPADDEFYFAFEAPAPRKTILVTSEPDVETPLKLSASISSDTSLKCETETVPVEQLASVDWENVALLLWQAPLPSGSASDLVQAFVDRGGQAVFFPPRSPSSDSIFGVTWTDWKYGPDPIHADTWRSDADALARTQSGAALPVGQVDIRGYCKLEGNMSPLAKLYGGDVLLGKPVTSKGAAYFWATTPAPRDSNLATSGVVLYAFVQRVLSAGAAVLSKAQQLEAKATENVASQDWKVLRGSSETLSTEYAGSSGVYSRDDSLLAVNRPATEDDTAITADAKLAKLFAGLDYVKVSDQADNFQALIEEIWRSFLTAMLIALIMEAVLCLPKPSKVAVANTSAAAPSTRAA
jgi:hypothetical protein